MQNCFGMLPKITRGAFTQAGKRFSQKRTFIPLGQSKSTLKPQQLRTAGLFTYASTSNRQQKEQYLFFYALLKHDCKTMSKFLEQEFNINTPIGDNGFTALHFLASQKCDSKEHEISRMATLSMLLKSGAYHNIKDETGNTALHCAVDSRNLSVIKLLLYSGSSWLIQNNNGLTALQLAENNGLGEFFNKIVDKVCAAYGKV